ncbi:hypothetical protein JQ608_06795 [Bradyrhizobium liaoningense]|uniref:hypothetical protein n=1 Tax=Bradyrhizobium liaoningense TaxID=43992 RepID=UPI001BAD85C8|nr:hypothetical protein [Bradyrhizobium liaoningense]MBR0876909.1 hypothetical protein [Bradyrhizobium liaoningense]
MNINNIKSNTWRRVAIVCVVPLALPLAIAAGVMAAAEVVADTWRDARAAWKPL